MATSNPKQEIVRSLQNLDAVQSQQVLGFIKGLTPVTHHPARHQYCKRKAMKEINQALRQMQPLA